MHKVRTCYGEPGASPAAETEWATLSVDGNAACGSLNWLVLPHYVYEVRVLGGGSVYPPYLFCHTAPTK